jgi:acyl dehydratase
VAEPVVIDGIEGLRSMIGQEVGPTEWLEITQDDIDTFADVARDHQWIHVDAERAAKESPFGTTIAHGNLTLSLIDHLRTELFRQEGVAMGVNMGWNRVRFPAPVPAGSKVRARAEVVSVDDKGGGWYEVVTKFTVDSDAGGKPVCVAESVGRALVPQE